MIELHTAATGNGRRPVIMLEECGVPYILHRLDLAKGEQKKPAYLALNPLGAIPTLIDKDGPGGQKLVLTQSAAILLYLAEKTGQFLPRDGMKRALAYQWLMHIMSDSQAFSGVHFVLGMLPEKPESAMAHLLKRMHEYFSFADKRLGEAEYLAGELSLADIALYPLAHRRADLIEQTKGLDNLKRWMKTMAARPGVDRAMKVLA
jgi:GSH-dependent disulfide-bond oxidoreductase